MTVFRNRYTRIHAHAPRTQPNSERSRGNTRIETEAGRECFAAALEYRERGWSVIPLCPGDHIGMTAAHKEICTHPGKRPLMAWEPFQARIASPIEIRDWWATWPSANVGVVCGRVSGLLAIDIDGEPGEDLLLELAAGEEIPPTLRFATGARLSYRLMYAVPRDVPCPTVALYTSDGGQPLKLLGDGSQTVMPPSLHYSAARYRWSPNYGPTEFELTPAPPWLLAALESRANAASHDRPATGYHGDGASIPHGSRNTHLTKIAGAVRRFGCTASEIRGLLELVNHRCAEPLSARELNAISNSVARYAHEDVPNSGTLGAIAADWEDRRARREPCTPEEIAEWLRQILVHGPVSVRTIYAAAHESGHSRVAVQTAKNVLRVVPDRVDVEGAVAEWTWSLPAN